MDKRYSIDTNTGWGAEWFQRWAVRRLVYFFLGVWPFMVIGLYPFWRAATEQVKRHSAITDHLKRAPGHVG